MTTYSLFSLIMEYGAIVYADPTRQLIVTYNGQNTFNIWAQQGGRFHMYDDDSMWTSGDDNVKKMSVDDLYFYCRQSIMDKYLR